MPRFELSLIARQEVAEGTMSFTFDLAGQDFTFKPGQYVSLTLRDLPYQDEKGNTRSFSIASSPQDAFLLIATRMRASALKRGLAELPLGSPAEIRGPLGSFTLPQDAGRPVILIAGGIGVTPFRSIVKHATERRLPHRLTLIHSSRTPRDAPFLDEFQRWEREHSNFRFVPSMTRPERSAISWPGRTGYVDAAMLGEVIEEPQASIVYLAGPPGMVQGVFRALGEAGVAEDAIRTEEFDGYE